MDSETIYITLYDIYISANCLMLFCSFTQILANYSELQYESLTMG